ncbi:beta-ketoacyl-[acyl-carrier-protein] synthase family protein [Microbacterium protaetiae]|uniref:Beta-ketoacyl-[acyl-carrier-protein] synthase family protein n=1 Tax=Microbacterium protaetiae TaxID=2509458 RepID=A0A4P6EBN9_9MICO|nr:beta-ketoacyl-[acyl-carrier-protein] synthase family protein [Microbacterium protaetiae]QAY59595.1 beta-ketoacyl-[acyl-carrier-protein] synthase family protein [Microbacterium protaetiae]
MTRAVITGMGAITPSGLDVGSMWDAVCAGRSAITTLDGPEFNGLAVRIGGQVRGFESALPTVLARRLTPVQHWAIAAADQALAQAGAIDGALPWDSEHVAVIAATGSGPVDAMQQATRALDERGPRAVPLSLSMHGAPDAAAAVITQQHRIFGPAQGVSATCASGAIGLGEALRRIRHGYAEAVVVVGMEDCLNGVNLSSNANMRALASGYENEPAHASRPFDAGRRGFVMSQGAAAVVVESADAARGRGAEVLAELIGFGASSDAYHPTAPDPQGTGGARAIRAALADAGLGADAIDHINAHGTGTVAGDAAELNALETALGGRARGIPISATKSSTGHLLGACGVVEAIITVQALRSGILPPTLNLDDPAFPEWSILTSPRQQKVDTVLSTSFGFGGHNGAVIIRTGDTHDRS